MVEHGLSMKDLTVLDVGNDPFRVDTPAGHRDGQWLATIVDQLVRTETVHLRGLHYILVTAEVVKPNGEVYRNTDPDWTWLQDKAADAARWLRYIPFDRIVDQRNDAPTVVEWKAPDHRGAISVGLHVEIPDADRLQPWAFAYDRNSDGTGFRGTQPYKLVFVGEKSSLRSVLGPVAQRVGADLYLPTGEISDTLVHRMAVLGKAEARPMVVLYFADCDPSGWQMGISLARKLQALEVLGVGPADYRVHRVALTPDQVREYGLPSTPMKTTETRADRWRAAHGVEQTEIDALASLRPELLRELAFAAVAPYFDAELESRCRRAYATWREAAQEAVDTAMDEDLLNRLRTDAEARLAELREQIDAINATMRLETTGLDLPLIDVPEAQVSGDGGVPLLDSRWSFAEQVKALRASKAYEGGGAS